MNHKIFQDLEKEMLIDHRHKKAVYESIINELSINEY